MNRSTVMICCLTLLAFASCKSITNHTPVCYTKPAPAYHTPQAAEAAQTFWATFQTSDYQNSDHALRLLMDAAQADPIDNHLVSLTGLCSFWKVVEHNRGGLRSADTHALAVQSLLCTEEAARREPENRLTPGFVSSAKYQLGQMENDPVKMSQACAELQHNTNVYPQFHGFVEGWVLTAMLPPDHPAYERAVEAYYKTLDSCAGIKVPRAYPRLGEFGFFVLAKKSVDETVCYNTNIAPHNVEGTLLGLGDALVKQGKKRQAKLVYESITRVPAYATWPFKDRLQVRLENMDALHHKFVADSGCVDVVEPAMLFQSTISCTGCHATCEQNSVPSQILMR